MKVYTIKLTILMKKYLKLYKFFKIDKYQIEIDQIIKKIK